VLRRLEDTAGRAGVTLETKIEDGVRLPIRPRMLRMVVQNLAENAIRYAGDGSTLTFRVSRSGEDVLLSAADDGVGVDEEDVRRLFERFYRSDRARASRGTGLGLAIVKHVVTSAGGEVYAESEPGHGLTVTCRFAAA
jgi:two-component system phosphate regulon sensor histidine kinase PhoR